MGEVYDQVSLLVPRYLSAYTGVSSLTLARIRFTALNEHVIFIAAKYINVGLLLFSIIVHVSLTFRF
jgi:hypothetical protein